MCGPSEYQNIEEAEGVRIPYAESDHPKVAIVVDDYLQKPSMDDKVATGKDQHAPMMGQTRMPADTSMAHAAATSFRTPREEDEIACGIELEAAKSDFQFNGVKHAQGTLRIVRLHKDGVCEVCIHENLSHECVSSALVFSPSLSSWISFSM